MTTAVQACTDDQTELPAGWVDPQPEWWHDPDMRRALAGHDIATVFRLLNQHHGMTQRAIAARTGQSQSEISDILGGRRVTSYPVLTRIADGLGIPRLYLGLAGATPPVQPRPAPRHPPATAGPGRLTRRWWTEPAIRDALQTHDLGAVFAFLHQQGITAGQIAVNTALPLTHVHAVTAGHATVDSHHGLVRLCAWLGIPPGLLGVSPDWTDPDQPDPRLPLRRTSSEIRALRTAHRASTRVFAARLGVSDRIVGKWESGQVATLRTNQVRRLDDLLLALDPAHRDLYDRALATATATPPA